MSTTDMSRRHDRRPAFSRWAVPITAVVLAAVYLVIGIVTAQAALAVSGPLIMLAYLAILLVFRRRSEPIGMLAGDSTDERRAYLQLRALAFTGNVVVSGIVIGALTTLAVDSRYFAVFGSLAVLAGVTYVLAVVVLSRRG